MRRRGTMGRQGERLAQIAGVWALLLMLPGAVAAAEPPSEEPIQPDRPGVADGSLVIGPRQIQVEIGLQRQDQGSAGTETRQLFTPTLLRYGVNAHWEARLETNAFSQVRVSQPGAGTSRTSGYSPVSLGVKYHFRDARPNTGNLSLGAILRVFPPSGSSDFRTHHTTTDLRLAADWGFAPNWSLNPNLGFAIYEDGSGQTFSARLFAMTLTYGPDKRFQPFIDVALQRPEERGGVTGVFLDGGATYLLNPDTQIDFEVGRGVSGRAQPDFLWTVGLSRRFGAGPSSRQ